MTHFANNGKLKLLIIVAPFDKLRVNQAQGKALFL